MNSKQKEIQEKCIAFAVKIDVLRKYLNKEKKEYNKADQVDRSAKRRIKTQLHCRILKL